MHFASDSYFHSFECELGLGFDCVCDSFMFTLGTYREPGIVVLGWAFFGCWELGAGVSFEARFSMFFS